MHFAATITAPRTLHTETTHRRTARRKHTAQQHARSSVHDFTPAKGNFSLLAPDVTALSLLGGAAALPEGVACLAGAAAAEGNPPAVFVTYGERPPLSPEARL